MRFGSKTHAQMSSRMTRLQGLRWIKGIAIRFSISPLAVENELDRPPQMSTDGEVAGIFIGETRTPRHEESLSLRVVDGDDRPIHKVAYGLSEFSFVGALSFLPETPLLLVGLQFLGQPGAPFFERLNLRFQLNQIPLPRGHPVVHFLACKRIERIERLIMCNGVPDDVFNVDLLLAEDVEHCPLQGRALHALELFCIQ